MQRYLMRAPASPFANPKHYDGIYKNLISNNSGNLLFIHSIVRALMLEDTQIDYIKTNKFQEEDIRRYNEEYDAFIIPLANAFRISFVNELKILTQMINALDIPCIVIGVGLQENNELRKIAESYPFDKEVKEFCDAVLRKSTSIGIRGEMTAQYLEQLGYERNKDFHVIGCPSMFLYGEKLPKPKKLNLSEKSRINLNCKVTLPQPIQDFMENVRKQFPNHYYIPQNLYELKLMYTGKPMKESGIKNEPQGYPLTFEHPLYKQNRIRGFVSAEAWFEFLKKGDLNLGTRIHGNIAAILSGTPAFIIAPDSRVLELARYHNIPHVGMDEVTPETDVYKMLENVDFNQILEGHNERFKIYLNFLNENNLDTIFNHELKKIPFDEKMKTIRFYGPVIPYPHVSKVQKKIRKEIEQNGFCARVIKKMMGRYNL